jgi:hypothetical protein
MNNHIFLIQQESQRYRNSLNSWVSQVRSARDMKVALNIANFTPSTGPMLRGMASNVASDKRRAEHEVDRILVEKLKKHPREQFQDISKVLRRMNLIHLPLVYKWWTDQQNLTF